MSVKYHRQLRAVKYHGQLTDLDGIHEPKGISSAVANSVYVANGNGSGSWVNFDNILNQSYTRLPTIGLYLPVSPTLYSIVQADTVLDLNLDFSLRSDVTYNFTYDNTTKYITYTGNDVIVFLFNCTVSLALIGSSTPTIDIYLYKNDASIPGVSVTRKFTNNDISFLSLGGIITLSLADTLKFKYKCDTVEDFNFYNLSLGGFGIVK